MALSAAFSARSEPSGYWCGSLADAPRGGAFKEGALRGPASVQPRSLNANTQRQGGRCFGFKRYVFGSAPLCAQQTNTAAIVCTITIYQIQVNIWKSFGNHLENCTTNKHCNKLCPMDVAATSVRRSDRVHRFADSGQACPSRLSICPLFGCAGHSEPSDPSRPARTGHANKCSASRIRRGSRTHLAEASAHGGPMKDRLYRDGSLRW